MYFSQIVSGVNYLLLISKFSLPLAYRLQNHPAKEKQGPVPEEMYQTADQYEASTRHSHY
jgi:hypothetical protein